VNEKKWIRFLERFFNYTPVSIFHNWSGVKWSIKTIEHWAIFFYCPWFGIGINIHPNRIKQIFGF